MSIKASEIPFNEAILRLASVHKRTVQFRYAKDDGSMIETRTLIPESVRKMADHLTFTGLDPDRDAPRAYRTDRIKGEVSIV
jgi:predicted DNA-binding transcriptional regulator YafY